MKIYTEYDGQIDVHRRYYAGQIRHGDRRCDSRRQHAIPVLMERRSLTGRRINSERRTLLRQSNGIIRVYGGIN